MDLNQNKSESVDGLVVGKSSLNLTWCCVSQKIKNFWKSEKSFLKCCTHCNCGQMTLSEIKDELEVSIFSYP